jgi:ribosomal subunit interface protein
MKLPLQVTFRNMTPSMAVRARVARRAEKLAAFHDRIMSCRVVIQAPHRRHHKGRLYNVSVDLKVPGVEIAANRQSEAHHAHEDIYTAIRDAFDAVERRLQDTARRRRGDIKTKAGGVVVSELRT